MIEIRASSTGPDYTVPMANPPLIWTSQYSLLRGRYFWQDLARVLGLTWLLQIIILAFMELAAEQSLRDFLRIIPLISAGVAALGIFMGLIAILLLRRGGASLYQMDSRGITAVHRSQTEPLVEAGQWLGLLSGQGLVWASSLLARSQERQFVPWRSIHRWREYPGGRVIEIYDSIHMAMRIYCPPEVYAQAVARLGQQAPPPGPSRRSWLGWLVLCGLVTGLGLSWEARRNDVGFVVVLAGMFLGMSGLLPGRLRRGQALFAFFAALAGSIHRLVHFSNSLSYEFWPALIATSACLGQVALALRQWFRRDEPQEEPALFDELEQA